MKPSAHRTRSSIAAASCGMVAGVASAIAGGLTVSGPATAKIEPAATVALPAAMLLAATSGGAAGNVDATGGDARLINAALPFDSAPVRAARPFHVSGGTNESRALHCLTQAIYYEAGFEPLAGRRAVAQVVLNRVRHPAYPKSVCGVVYQGAGSRVCQFTFVCDGALSRPPEAGAWRQARAIAEAALAGAVERSVGQATHYHANYVAPRWAPMLAKVHQIGTHIFYRWPGSWGQPSAFTGRYIGEPADPASLARSSAAVTLAEAAAGGEVAGPPVRRAPNDVGGLLDTSKGWKLNIPNPVETRSAAVRVLTEQKQATAALPAAVARTEPPLGGL